MKYGVRHQREARGEGWGLTWHGSVSLKNRRVLLL